MKYDGLGDFRVSDLSYPSDVLDLNDLTDTDSIQAGTRAYLSCKEGSKMDEGLENYVELKGFGASLSFTRFTSYKSLSNDKQLIFKSYK